MKLKMGQCVTYGGEGFLTLREENLAHDRKYQEMVYL